MRIRLILVAALVAALASLPTAAASASSGSFAFRFQIGEGTISGIEPPVEIVGPDVSMAANGDTLTMTGSGRIDFRINKGESHISSPGARGGGTFAHRSSDGTLFGSGTWIVTELLDFHSYGGATAAQGVPPDNWGGLAQMRVHLVATAGPAAGTESDGLLWVDCLLGSVPRGTQEGFMLSLPGLIDFDQPVSGETLFVAVAN